jgi:hypothetical protein
MTGQGRFYLNAGTRDAQQLDAHRNGGVGWVSAGVFGTSLVVLVQSLRAFSDARSVSARVWACVLVLAAIAAAWLIVPGALRRLSAALLGDDASRNPEASTRRQALDLLGGFLCGLVTIGVFAAVPYIIVRMNDVLHIPIPAWVVREEHAWIVTGLGLVTLAGAFHHTFAEQRAFAEHRDQYERMTKLFERGRAAFAGYRAAGDAARMEKMIVTLGTEALAEHADWLVLHRERPLQIPKVEL